MQTSGRVEYMFVTPNEEIEIKLNSQHFQKISCRRRPCSNDNSYSAIQCEEICFWQHTTKEIGCRGPWMTGLPLPVCNNYTAMKELIVKYEKWVIFMFSYFHDFHSLFM